jgi:D-glycero-alpha-D-manno-heptose-7-phosphate kinase
VSFFGGGTDHPAWFKGIGAGRGAVISTSINKYVYLTLRRLPPIFNFKYRVAWRIVEEVNAISEIQHPVVREVLRHYAPDDGHGYEINFHADLPARSGLGSSSAFTVAALHAVSKQYGNEFNKRQLCTEAIKLEQEHLKEPVGCQDQIAVAHGGFNRIDFHASGDFSVSQIDVSPRRLKAFESHLMLYFTGFTRDAGNIEKAKFQNLSSKSDSLSRLFDLVGEAQAIVEDPRSNLNDFGALLNEAWMAKRNLSKAVSNSNIDAIYDTAIRHGATGGKLLGAGGGGFLLFFVSPEKQEDVRAGIEALGASGGSKPVEVPVAMEQEGSRVVLYQPDYDSANVYAFAKPPVVIYG